MVRLRGWGFGGKGDTGIGVFLFFGGLSSHIHSLCIFKAYGGNSGVFQFGTCT